MYMSTLTLSLEYELERAETTKSEKFGLSNITMMLLPLVSCKKRVNRILSLPQFPQSRSATQNLAIDYRLDSWIIIRCLSTQRECQRHPKTSEWMGRPSPLSLPSGMVEEESLNTGYGLHHSWHAIVSVVYIPACFLIQFIYKVHLKSVDGDSWVVFKHVPVLYLSEWPKLEENFFGDLKGEYIVSAENH